MEVKCYHFDGKFLPQILHEDLQQTNVNTGWQVWQFLPVIGKPSHSPVCSIWMCNHCNQRMCGNSLLPGPTSAENREVSASPVDCSGGVMLPTSLHLDLILGRIIVCKILVCRARHSPGVYIYLQGQKQNLRMKWCKINGWCNFVVGSLHPGSW